MATSNYKHVFMFSVSTIQCLPLLSESPVLGKQRKLSRTFPTVNMLNLTLKVLVATIDAQWEGMGDVGSTRYEPALLPPCPTIRVLSYSN